MNKYYFLFILVILTSCKKDKVKINVKACFDYSSNLVIGISDTIKFSNCSEDATSFFWDFGDGATSTEKTPYHIFKNSGNFIIKLEAKNNNLFDTLSKTIMIVDKNLTDFHDTSIYALFNVGTVNLNLDIDKDSIKDISIMAYNYYSSYSHSECYVKITPQNGYEIAFSNYVATTWDWNQQTHDTIFHIDTIMVPKVFNYNDTIRIDGNYTLSPLMINYNEKPTGPSAGSRSGLSYMIHENGYYYIAFYKLNGQNHNLVWLKLKNFLPLSGIIINSGKYIKNGNFLIIE